MRRLLFSALLSCTLAGLAATPAVAATPAPPPAQHKGVVGVDFGFTAFSAPVYSSVHISPVFFGKYLVADKLTVSGQWGFAYASYSPDAGESRSDLSVSNPVIAVHYALLGGAGVDVSVGAGIGIPVAAGSSVAHGVNQMLATGTRGRFLSPLWVQDTVTLLVPLAATVRFTNKLQLGVELTPELFIPSDEGDTEFGLNLAVDVAYRGGPYVPGIRLAGDWLPTFDGDNFQSSIEPYFQIRFVKGFAQLGFVLNLDTPRGFSFDDAGIWGLVLKGGYYL